MASTAWNSWKSIRAQKPWRHPKISKTELAWLAGLLEGEGSFSLQCYRRHRAEKSGGYQAPSIELKMTDRDVVQRAGKLLGGKQRRVRSWLPKKEKRAAWKGSRKRVFIWRVNGLRAVHLMQLLLSFMGKRRAKRIRELIELHEKQGPRGGKGLAPRLRFTNVAISRREFNQKRRERRRRRTLKPRSK